MPVALTIIAAIVRLAPGAIEDVSSLVDLLKNHLNGVPVTAEQIASAEASDAAKIKQLEDDVA